MVTTVPIFTSSPGIGQGGQNVGLKIQLASTNDGSYVPVIALDSDSSITIGSVSQEGVWVVGINQPLPAGTNSIGQVTANAGANLNTSALALESGGNLAALAALISAGKLTVDPSGVTSPVSLASLPSLAAGTNEIGFVGPSGSNGVDYSANAPSLSGLSLLATIPANAARLGYFIQAQDTDGLTVVMDDQAGSLTPTIILLSGPGVEGNQGGSLSMSGIPHTGRIRLYGASSGVQMAARAW